MKLRLLIIIALLTFGLLTGCDKGDTLTKITRNTLIVRPEFGVAILDIIIQTLFERWKLNSSQ